MRTLAHCPAITPQVFIETLFRITIRQHQHWEDAQSITEGWFQCFGYFCGWLHVSWAVFLDSTCRDETGRRRDRVWKSKMWHNPGGWSSAGLSLQTLFSRDSAASCPRVCPSSPQLSPSHVPLSRPHFCSHLEPVLYHKLDAPVIGLLRDTHAMSPTGPCIWVFGP